MKRGLTFEVEGQIYQLRFDINTLCEVEDLLGKAISEIGNGMGMRELRTLFSCAILPKMSLTEAGELMSAYVEENDMEKLNDLITKALDYSMGEAKSEEELLKVVQKSEKKSKK